MKVFDGFIFNDELDLLELRFMETYDLVDWYVLVEGPTTFMLDKKPLHYAENKDRFSQWNDKVIHIIADDIEVGPHPITEIAQRNCIARGFELAEPEDLILVSDVDEIISRNSLHRLKKSPPVNLVVLLQYLYYYRVNCLQNQVWCGPVARLRGDDEIVPQEWRDKRGSLQRIPGGGWHFSWMGDVPKLQNKIRCIDVVRDSGGKMVPPSVEDTEYLQECISTGKDLFGREDDYAQKRTVPITPGKGHPKCINDWLEKHPELQKWV